MRYIIYQLVFIAVIAISALPAYCQKEKATAVDVTLGNANVNFNPINNNKYSTQLRTFAPTTMTPDQIDLSRVSTPPVTGIVKTIDGGYPTGAFINSDIVDPDVKDAKEAEELKRKTGMYYSKPIETVADGQPIEQSDIQDFLKNYYHYLKDSELPSASLPVVPALVSVKSSKVSSNGPKNETALLAKEQKLVTGKMHPASKRLRSDSH